MNLKEMALNDLKAAAYDRLAIMQRNQDELNAINREIQNRPVEGPKVEPS